LSFYPDIGGVRAKGCGGLVSVRTLEENCFILGKQGEAAQRESDKKTFIYLFYF